jgi:hypothetical protein
MRNITLDIPPEYLDTDYEGFFLLKESLIFWAFSTFSLLEWNESIDPGFLATVFANFDVSPELSGLSSDHSSSANRHLTVGEPHYAEVVTDEANRKKTKYKIIF